MDEMLQYLPAEVIRMKDAEEVQRQECGKSVPGYWVDGESLVPINPISGTVSPSGSRRFMVPYNAVFVELPRNKIFIDVQSDRVVFGSAFFKDNLVQSWTFESLLEHLRNGLRSATDTNDALRKFRRISELLGNWPDGTPVVACILKLCQPQVGNFMYPELEFASSVKKEFFYRPGVGFLTLYGDEQSYRYLLDDCHRVVSIVPPVPKSWVDNEV